MLPLAIFLVCSVFILFHMNQLTDKFCLKIEIPEEKQTEIFMTINVLILILLVSTYVEILFS